MATNTDDSEEITRCFRTLHEQYLWLINQSVNCQSSNCQLSMGMSDDYPLALANGSTMLRIGSAIFDA